MRATLSVRGLPLWIACLFMAGVFTPLAVSPAAGQSAEIALTDKTGDVSPVDPNVPGVPLAQVNGGLDLKAVRIFGESGTNFIIEVDLNDMTSEVLPPVLIGRLVVAVCFKWNGNQYAAISNFRTGGGGTPYKQWLTAVDGECARGVRVLAPEAKRVDNGQNVTLDVPGDKITMSIPRVALGEIGGAPPKAGDTIGDVFVLSWDETNVNVPEQGIFVTTRYDAMPDAAPDSGKLTLAYDTGGEGTLKAIAESNSSSIVCGTRSDMKFYAFEAGGKRGVPVIFQNLGTDPKEVAFSVQTLAGADWKPKIVPQLTIGPKDDIGNVTVTVILDTPASTKHKDCAILMVRGTDKSDPLNFAETLVGAVAVRPPDPENKRLYFHARPTVGDVCGAEDTWLNTLQDDPDDGKGSVALKQCRDPNLLSLSNVGFVTGLDVNPNKDLVINTSATDQMAVATLNLRSDYADTRARLSVDLVTRPRTGDGELVGEGRVDATIKAAETSVQIPLRISFTRDEVGTGDPSRVLFSEDGIGLSIRYEALPSDSTVSDVTVAGHVVLRTTGTFIDLPVWSTIKRNVADPGASGSLISLKPANELPKFAYPGAARLFNFTVLNEGPEHEVAVFEATFTGAKGWKATFVPSDTVELAPGERKLVQAALVPPASANESESVIFDVVVHSQKDPTARSSVAVKVLASREGGVPQEAIPSVAVQKDKGLLPGPGLLELVALVALVGIVLRRRR